MAKDNVAVSSVDNSPLVKFVELILDDENGIKDTAFDALLEFLTVYYGTRPLPARLQKILEAVEGAEGRVYIDEDWETSEVEIHAIHPADDDRKKFI